MRSTFCYAAFLMIAAANSQTIAIDPGHPSEVGAGTHGLRSTEMRIAWEVAGALRSRLESRGYKVVLTKRNEIEFVSNRKRAQTGNASHAALMVRLHCDASRGSGFAVYFPSQKGRSGGFVGPPQQVLRDSQRLAGAFHSAMASVLAGLLPDNGLKTDLATAVGAKQGALTGSIFSRTPVLLVEMVVLTNPKDEAFILSGAGRMAMVDALAKGVESAVSRR